MHTAKNAFRMARQGVCLYATGYSLGLIAQVLQSIWLVGGAVRTDGRTAPHISQKTVPSLNRVPQYAQYSPVLGGVVGIGNDG